VKDWISPLPSKEKEEAAERGEVVALIKPQFEAGRKDVARGKGVVRDPEIHQRVLLDILASSEEIGYQIKGLKQSPVLGPKGNIEFLLHLALPQLESIGSESIKEMVYSIVKDTM
jgi:23S rRNA (cytidine1920-2'-O)/16S rRNA (cytidine1409-2'-O)-methyltransferase